MDPSITPPRERQATTHFLAYLSIIVFRSLALERPRLNLVPSFFICSCPCHCLFWCFQPPSTYLDQRRRQATRERAVKTITSAKATVSTTVLYLRGHTMNQPLFFLKRSTPCPYQILRKWRGASSVSGFSEKVYLDNMLTHGNPPVFRDGVHLFISPYAVAPVPSLSGHAVTYQWCSPPIVRRHRASILLKVLPVTGVTFSGTTMDQVLCLYFPIPTTSIGTVYKWITDTKSRVSMYRRRLAGIQCGRTPPRHIGSRA